MAKRSQIVLLLYTVLLVACKDTRQASAPAHPAPVLSGPEQRRGIAIPVGKGPDAMLVLAARQRLYVANTEDDFVSIIDTATDTPAATRDRIADIHKPMGFAWLGQGQREVAVSTRGHEIVIVDAQKDQVIRRSAVIDELSGIVATPDGKFLFAAATTSDRVLKIDATRLAVVETYPTGKGPDGIGGTAARDRVYVTNPGDGTISMLAPSRKNETTRLHPGGKPELVSETPDRSLLFISNFTAGKVHILDTATGQMIRELGGIAGAEGTTLGANNVLYVVSFTRERVYAFPNRGSQARLGVEYIAGKQPIGIMATATPAKIYVANYGDNTLSVFATGPAATSQP